MDPNEYAKAVYGLKKGDPVSPAMAAQIQEELSYYRKKKVDAMVKAEFDAKNGTSSQPKFMSLTNDSGRVIDVMVKPDGEPVVVEPKVQNTQQGMFTMSNPTNAVPLVDPSTGQQLQGYAAEANYGGAPAPMAGGGAFAGTNAPTPSPTPYPEGAKIRNKRDGMLYQVVNGVPQLIPGQ